ncbi:MAG: PKD domain-containing protein [Kiritimatiellae bacterium]|nr:PKD domain-containing protein [Kiritimatiellia bacterium]
MNMGGIKKVTKKLAFPLIVATAMLVGFGVQAQTLTNGIASISSDQANQLITAAGQTADIKITLYGHYELMPVVTTPTGQPQIRMIVNGNVAWATLVGISPNASAVTPRTEVLFRYTVKPGDMAMPLRLYGNAGVGGMPGNSFQFQWNGWKISQVGFPSTIARWVFDNTGWVTGDIYDPDFTAANVKVQTLKFVDAYSPTFVAATETANWRVSSVNAIESASVDFYVWPADYSVVQMGAIPNQPLLVSMPTGSTEVDFSIRGLAVGSTHIYLQRTFDYNNNTSLGVTNYIRRTITVTAPPEPTVRVVMVDNGGDNITMNESGILSTGNLRVEISEPYTSDVYVQISGKIAGTPQSSVTFASDPFILRIAAGDTVSPDSKFNVPDGTLLSGATGVTLTPVIQDVAAKAHYVRVREATVYVNNTNPVITRPVSTDLLNVTRGVSTAFDFTVVDVPADRASMITRWNFGDGTAELVVTGHVGQAFHTYVTTGNKVVKVQAQDKDGALSTEVLFNVSVTPPLPQPSVTIVPDKFVYNETTTNATGELRVYLSESFGEDVWVRIMTDPAVQANVVLSTTNAFRIAAGTTNFANTVRFSLVDGTPFSALTGITFKPVVTNSFAAAHYTDLKEATIFVNNVPPVIIRPKASNLALPADPTYGYDRIPMGAPFTFTHEVFDVLADRASMKVTWNFGDATSMVAIGANGTVSHTFTSLGNKIVSVQAEDKDGDISTLIEFKVTVVEPPPPPTVRILTPASVIYEDSDPLSNYITVFLTEAFTNTVVVNLTMDIPNIIALSQSQVVFGVGETAKDVYFTTLDGTAASLAPGVRITPAVIATPASVARYATLEHGYVRVRNVDPVIITPNAPLLPGPSYTVPQGTPWNYFWNVKDVLADRPSMQVTWYWGDGVVETRAGASGSIAHTYNMLGEAFVTVVAVDKDGGRSEVRFSILILPAKVVNVTPIGPNLEASYYGAAGIGNGIVVSRAARSWENRNNVYIFNYDPNVQSATLEAIPYKAGNSFYTVINYDRNGIPSNGRNFIHDSFFYVWVGADQGLPEAKLVPSTTTPTTAITLPEVQQGDNNSVSSVEIRDVQAIFSREWRTADNMGDINLDGIPDKIAQAYGLPAAVAGTVANPGGIPDDLLDARGFNGDEDYLPIVNSGNIANVFAPIGDPFTAFLEVRGFHPGLNNHVYGSDPDGPMDEPGADGTRGGTNPLMEDTDGDGFPDGWEYYFWYNAKFQDLTGESYNPQNVAQGIPIGSKVIELAFDPLTPAIDPVTVGSAVNRDLDNDGLTDLEELVLGTNPVHWDTDGDGMADGWEVMRGLNPNDGRDGLLPAMNNPDGDYMAYASVTRQWVTVVGGGVTNNFLAVGASEGETAGTFNRWYHYGDDNAPLAVGRPYELQPGEAVIEIAAEDVDALILHFQVRDEFGFDPRTAWTAVIDPGRFAGTGVAGGAPNTKPFTSVDEYLLMKFMSENRLNGIGANVPATQAAWSACSTHPLTPDTDASPAGVDSLPDGWELYVMTRPGTRNVVISPWNILDRDFDMDLGAPPGDGLNVRREYAGLYSSAQYANPGLYGTVAMPGVVSITPSPEDQQWVNKFWPTDPWNKDTDGDGLIDSAERAFIYGNPVDSGGLCTPGGGLNPNSKDTDRDALPDGWESQFAGTPVANDGSTTLPPALPGQPAAPVAMVITNGMDGTVVDWNQDWDNDGLKNYQEYWTQAVRSYRYDVPESVVPMDITFDVSVFFVEITEPWDIARYPWGLDQPASWLMPPVTGMYVSTDPRNPDSDFDGMDDFYEVYHGLNPILGIGPDGDRIATAYDHAVSAYANPFYFALNGLPMNFQLYPWLAGLPEADCDGDGLVNFEEMLLANPAAAPNYNTDPSPLWMTDYTNPNSHTYKFYHSGSMFFWPGTANNRAMVAMSHYSMFEMEINEGYDTDNDGLSDKAELVHSRNPLSDPRDHDDPIRRQAIWFSGTNSAARTITSHSHDLWSFRSFTAECWARPELINRHQVILERSVPLAPSDMNDTLAMRDRKTFQIGIAADGRVYAMFDGSGSEAHDHHTSTVVAYGPTLVPNTWTHIAARMDGAAGKFDILVNGELYQTIDTQLIPATGMIAAEMGPGGTPVAVYDYAGTIVVGASDLAPDESVLTQTWEGYELFYQGFVDEVRIWDGARSLSEIYDDMSVRYTREKLEENRRKVRFEMFLGGSRVMDAPSQLSPELLYHYTFDNIFGGDDPATVATAPRGFNDPAVAINRIPAADADALGFGQSPVTSTVYTDYQYLSLIENSVAHMPDFGGIWNVDGIVQVNLSDTVADSVYWSESAAGGVPASNVFPNKNNPYGISWVISDTDPLNAGFSFASDMLPLGGAFAKTVAEMWDGHGPSAPWLETGVDSNSDGLPDWWMASTGTVGGWSDLYPDNSGRTNGEMYQRDIAHGATPGNPSGVGGFIQTADQDGDGLPDWWEDIYSLDKRSAVGLDGASGDPDRDGLSNLAEYLISEVYQFRYLSPRLFKTAPGQKFSDYFMKEGAMTFGAMFTDHDFIEDYWEDLYDPYYINSFVYDAHEDNDEDGWSNWAEARYASAYRNIHPDSITTLLPAMASINEYPIPVIETTLRYDGFQTGGNLVIKAYTKPEMDGKPDATYTYVYNAAGNAQSTDTYALGAMHAKRYVVTLSPGAVVPGSIRMTFTDTWNGQTADTGNDADGKVYATALAGYSIQIGTINYVTGELDIDLSVYGDSYIRGAGWDDALPFEQQNRDNYLLLEASSVNVTYSINLSSTWPKKLYLGKASQGYVKEGLNYFFAFLDLDASGTWNAGEPCGLPEQFATDIGWDRNQMAIELTDYRAGYLRLDLTTGLRSEDVLFGLAGDIGGGGGVSGASSAQRVQILRTRAGGTGTSKMVLNREITADRTYIHEGDLLAQGDLALDWDMRNSGVAPTTQGTVYEVYVGGRSDATNGAVLVQTFTNAFDQPQIKAVSTKPIHGSYVYTSRPIFRWTMPDNYPAFAIEIKKGSPTGPTVYTSGAMKAPSRDMNTGEYIWEAPIHAGNLLPSGHLFANNTVYAWRVSSLDAKFTATTGGAATGWSEWKMFRLDVNAPMQSSGYGMIEATVKYFGPATGNLAQRVKVAAYTTRDFTGVPVAQYTLAGHETATLIDQSTTNINAVLRGLTPSQFAGKYYVMAYIDSNNNNVRDVWESWGYANYYGKNVLIDTEGAQSGSIFRDLFGGTIAPYTAMPCTVEMNTKTPRVMVIIEDTDVDQDWFPDAWEFEMNPGTEFLDKIGASASWPTDMGNTEVNPTLTTGAWPAGTIALLTLGSTDSDGDGIDDFKELILGTDPFAANPPKVVENLRMGLGAEDELRVDLTGLARGQNGLALDWSFEVERKDSNISPAMLQLMSASADGQVDYFVDYKYSLSDPDWVTVKSGRVKLENTQPLVDEITNSAEISEFQGFFRVRVGN